jgi:hypothetical protein
MPSLKSRFPFPKAFTCAIVLYGAFFLTLTVSGQSSSESLLPINSFGMHGIQIHSGTPYLETSPPERILPEAQEWEGDQQPHTLSVVELDRDGFKYWGYYGLNKGRGIGLARSNDFVHWTKYEKNPLWLNARWPSAIIDPSTPGRVYLAITRDYDTLHSRIVLASSEDGFCLQELRTLVDADSGGMPLNQNPNLYIDPRSAQVVLTFFRGDAAHSSIIIKRADHPLELATAHEKLLLSGGKTLAAPNLLYLPKIGIYYLVTEICPEHRDRAEWQVKAFVSRTVDGPYVPVSNNPVQAANRACLFQHLFDGIFYGFQSHLTDEHKWEMELIRQQLP